MGAYKFRMNEYMGYVSFERDLGLEANIKIYVFGKKDLTLMVLKTKSFGRYV